MAIAGPAIPAAIPVIPAKAGKAGTRKQELGGLAFEVVDPISDSSDLLSVLIGDLNVECLLELHDQFNGVERIRTQVVGEGSFGCYLSLVDAKLGDEDFFDFR